MGAENLANKNLKERFDGSGFDQAIASLIALFPDQSVSLGSEQYPFTGSRFDGADGSARSLLSGIGIGRDKGLSADILAPTATDRSGKTARASSGLDAPSTVAVSVSSAVTIADGGSAEIDGAGTQSVTFTGATGTLTIDHSLAFTGAITGLAGTDALDLVDISYGAATTATFLGNTTGGTLTVSDGSHTANISLMGNYLSSSWTLSSDGQGGTVVVDPIAPNNWQDLKIGGGGYVTGIDVAPDDTMVVRTDTYGAYIWNGTQWQQLVTSTSMPAADAIIGNGQGVYEIQIAPSSTNILYMMYNGYVYRSSDKGTTWAKTAFAQVTEDPNDPYRVNGQKMAVDPNNPNIVYVGTPQNGLFVTTNGGASWQQVSAVPVSATDASGQYPGITGLSFDPTSGVTGGKTNTIYASSYGHGVFESTNGGVSWVALSGGPTDVESSTVSAAGVYYAIGDNNTALWRYTNGAWTKLISDTANGFHSVATDPFNPNRIVIANSGGSLNESLDGGATWSGQNWNGQSTATDVPWLANSAGFMALGGMVFDQLVPDKIWASGGVGVWHASVPTTLLWNTPVVWNSQTAGIEQLVANEILVAPGGKPVLASWDRSFFYVSDPNSFPSNYGVGAPASFSAGWSIDYASSTPSFLVGINDWWGVEQSGYSSDGGQTWHMFSTMPSFAGTTIGGTIAASTPKEIVWAPADGVAPQYTKDGGLTWKPVVLPGVTDWSTFDYAYYLDRRTVTADRVLPDTFYLYYVSTSDPTANGVYKSSNGGDTWTKVFNGQIGDWTVWNARIEAVPGEAGNLFFTGGPQGPGGPHTAPYDESFFQSTDGGASWTAVPNVLEVQTFGFGAPASTGGYPSIYIVGWVNSVYGIWQSNDDAKSWTQIGDYPTGSLSSIRTIAGDPNIYGQVYVGFAGDGYAYLPAASVSNSPTPPVLTSPGGTTATETGTPLPPTSTEPPLISTGDTNSSEPPASSPSIPIDPAQSDPSIVTPSPDKEAHSRVSSIGSEFRVAHRHVRGDETTIASSAAGSDGASERSLLSFSFQTDAVVASVDGAASRGNYLEHRIALLSQYTAAGFHDRGDTGGLANDIRAANANEPTQMLSLPQAVEKFGRSHI
jgi:hypothetical protein